MTIYITRKCKVIELTEAMFMAAYDTCRLHDDEKLTINVADYNIEMTVHQCYHTILEAKCRQYDKKLAQVDEN